MRIPDALIDDYPQLENIEFYIDGGLFVKQMSMPFTGTLVPQHSHAYDHVSMLALGSVRVWADNILVGDFTAPKPITIKAGVKHTFMSLEDDTLIYCIHRLDENNEVPILEEHQLRG